MAGETDTRQWWFVVRRTGHALKKVKLNIPLVKDQSDLDGVVGPIQVAEDFDLVDSRSGLDDTDIRYVAQYEVYGVTAAWEITYIE